MNQKRIIATFNPQAWFNDCSFDVDPEGETQFDVTDAVLAMDKDVALSMEDGRDNTDDLRFTAHAPQWVRDWGGPFCIEVQESIEQFFSEAP